MICRFCKTENSSKNEKCSNCGAPLPKRLNLEKKDYELLKNYINSLNSTLNAAKKNSDMKSSLALFVGAIVVLGGIYFFYVNFDHKILIIILSIIIIIASILTWGGLINHFETKAMDKKFHSSMKKDIEEYLTVMNFKISDFKNVVAIEQEKDANIMKYIDFL